MENEDLTYKVGEIRVESRAAANAIRALQDRIRDLERDKENLENHIEYLLRSCPVEGKMWERSPKEPSDKYEKLFENLEVLLSKAEFLDKELKRKEQQYLIDKENWLLERKMLLKSLTQSRGKTKPEAKGKASKNPGKKSENTKKSSEKDSGRSPKSSVRDLEQNSGFYEEKIQELTQKLRESEAEKEEFLEKSQNNYNKSLELLEEELKILKQSQNTSDLVIEINNLKKIIQSQNKTIEGMHFEIDEWKINYRKLEELSQFLRKDSPKFEVQTVPINILEENIEKLNARYKELLQRTRKQDENYPELRNELRNTAFDLEYQSFLLDQQKNIKET